MTRAAALLGIVAAVSFFLYGFFLLEAVAHTAGRAQAERKIESLTSKLSVLEEEYLTSTKDITLDHARELGFVTPNEVSTVYATDRTRALSVRAQY